MLTKQKERGKLYAAICASPAVVFAVGSIAFSEVDSTICWDGEARATRYLLFHCVNNKSFREAIPNYKNEKVVVSDNCSKEFVRLAT